MGQIFAYTFIALFIYVVLNVFIAIIEESFFTVVQRGKEMVEEMKYGHGAADTAHSTQHTAHSTQHTAHNARTCSMHTQPRLDPHAPHAHKDTRTDTHTHTPSPLHLCVCVWRGAAQACRGGLGASWRPGRRIWLGKRQ